MKQPVLTRRNALLSSLFGSGYLGLKAVATGLPAWFLANPRKATAADLECAIQAKENLQYLIMNVSSMGDPISCNCPGTYDGDAAAAIHPDDPSMAPVQFALGDKMVTAATPWGTLLDTFKGRTNFFHHYTGANNHGDQPKVSRLMGKTTGGEMLVSAYAKILSGCLGTVQPEPVSLSAGGNASELISYQGRSMPPVSPTQLRQLLTGSSGGGFGGGSVPGMRGGGSSGNVLVALRPIRDTYLDKLNELAKQDSTGVQSKFLDALSRSQEQVRSLKDTLGTLLGSINADDVAGQALAAAALIAANVTPVVTVKIDFGGDNHSDGSLANETAAHTDSKRGVAGINSILQALVDNGLEDKVTFSTLNVFGRNLNGISKTESKQGRDHYGSHSVAVMIGKNVMPGITGGVTNVTGSFGSSGTALGAGDIDSSTGMVAPPGSGDVDRTDTDVAMARTLGAALGIPQSEMDKALVMGGTGKVIPSTVVSVPT